jgi:hypothetical protein
MGVRLDVLNQELLYADDNLWGRMQMQEAVVQANKGVNINKAKYMNMTGNRNKQVA